MQAPARVSLADYDNDGLLDLAVPAASGANGRAQIHRGLGNGTTAYVGSVTLGQQPNDMINGDFDGDGNQDLLASTIPFGGNIVVVYGFGNGGFTRSFFMGGVSGPTAVTVGDFNADGHLDYASSNLNGRNVVVRLGLGNGLRGPAGFSGPRSIGLGGRSPRDIVAADVNGDGNLDLATANQNSVTVLLGDGLGNFPTVKHFHIVTGAFSLASGDFNQDGAADLATTGNFVSSSDQITVLQSNRIGGFLPPTVLRLPAGPRAVDIEAADVTGDGFVDVVTANRVDGSVSVFAGNGTGGFGGAITSLINDDFINSLSLGDLDGSGTLDIVVTRNPGGYTNDGVTLLLNGNPNEGFVSPFGDFSTLTEQPDGTFTRRLKNGTQIEFNASGLQTAAVDRNGNITTYAYDPDGRLVNITDPVGLENAFTYSGGYLTGITDPANRTTTFEHDAAGNLLKITDPDLTAREFTYDTRHRMISQTSKRGFLTRYEYSGAGRNSKALRPDGSTREVSPAQTVGLVDPASGLGTESQPAPVVRPADLVATFIDGKGNTTSFKTDTFGAATVQVDPLGRETRVARNNHGNPVITTMPNGAVLRRVYDQRGNVLTQIEVEGQLEEQQTHFEYDPLFNQVTKITDPAGKVTTVELDAKGNSTKTTNPLGGERTRTYDSRGLVLTDTDENGETTTFTYDARGNIETITDPEGNVTRFIRDAAGNVLTVIAGVGAPEQRTRTFTFDSLNRLTSATDGTPAVTQFRYDGQGNLIETQLPTGQIEGRTYDGLHRVVVIHDPIRGTSRFTYDPNGNLIHTRNALNDPTAFEYDAANQLIKITDALNGKQVFTYDVQSNVKSLTDARNQNYDI